MFTASKVQVCTYLIGICGFSISLLVFLNATISFVITTILHRRNGIGDAVGTLGFADELLAIFACPFWGLVSDYTGSRFVCVLAYSIVGVSLFLFVQVQNTYPQLLLVRLLFSVGAAGTSTMITALLPSMTSSSAPQPIDGTEDSPLDPHSDSPSPADTQIKKRKASGGSGQPHLTTRSAGFVGLFSGCGALIALLFFLRLPDTFQRNGASPEKALVDSYYIVGAVALSLSIICAFGLGRLRTESSRGRKKHGWKHYSWSNAFQYRSWNLIQAFTLGFQHRSIGVAYVGGLVARASSVGITLFIPLLVNNYFITTGRCDNLGRSPADVKEKCRGAYVLSAELTGVSQLVALIAAPCFGFLAERYRRFNVCLLGAALAGIIGYVSLSSLRSPKFNGDDGTPWIFVIMALIGISQIGAIVCSLGLLSRSVLELRISETQGGQMSGPAREHREHREHDRDDQETVETSEADLLLARTSDMQNLEHLKGSIAGIYSFGGGVGILFLTKVGGLLFDRMTAAPFYILAVFNASLLFVGSASGLVEFWEGKRDLE